MNGYNLNNYIGGEYLNKDDLKTSKAWVCTGIREVKIGEDGKPKLQLELEYKTIKKSFTLNATNIKVLISVFGSDSHELIGKIMVFVPTKVSFKNEIKDSILVDEEETKLRNGQITHDRP